MTVSLALWSMVLLQEEADQVRSSGDRVVVDEDRFVLDGDRVQQDEDPFQLDGDRVLDNDDRGRLAADGVLLFPCIVRLESVQVR